MPAKGFHRNFCWTIFVKMNEQNSIIFVQNFREFRCIFDEIFDLIFPKISYIFTKFLFNFRSIKIKKFSFRIKKIVFLRKKGRKFRTSFANFETFAKKILLAERNFRDRNWTKIWKPYSWVREFCFCCMGFDLLCNIK